MVLSEGLTEIDCSVGVGAVTERTALPLMDPEVAVMVEVPWATPVARPEEFTVATFGIDEFHATDDDNVFEVPSL
jgi:hypothetical protein